MGHRSPVNAIATGGKKTIDKLKPRYDDLSQEVRDNLHEKAEAILLLMGTDVESMLKIGRKFNEVKGSLNHGQWLHWLSLELKKQIHPNTAGLYMRSDRFCTAYFDKHGKFPNLGNLSRTSMYLLSGPDVPEELQFQILDRASVEPVPYHEVKAAIDAALAPIRAERRAKKKADKTKKDAENDSDPDPTPGPKDLSKEDFRDTGLRIIERLGQYEENDILFDDISCMAQKHDLTISIEARGHPRHFLQFDFRVPRPPKGYVPQFARGEGEPTEGSKPDDPLGPYYYR